MIIDRTAYERMVRWCQAQTVIEGTRTITHDPLGAPGERERGEIDAEGFDGQEWLGDNVGQVIDRMNDSLGAVDDEAYRIVEMSVSLAKVSHIHRCPTGSHEWEHKTYSCNADEEMVCPEHEKK